MFPLVKELHTPALIGRGEEAVRFQMACDAFAEHCPDAKVWPRRVLQDLEVFAGAETPERNLLSTVLLPEEAASCFGRAQLGALLASKEIERADAAESPPVTLTVQAQQAVLEFLSEESDEALKTLEDEVFLFEWPLEALNDLPLVLDALNVYFLVLTPVANVALPVLMLLVPVVIMRCRGTVPDQYLAMLSALTAQAGAMFSAGGKGALAVGIGLLLNLAAWLFSVWQTWQYTKEHWLRVMQMQRRVHAVGQLVPAGQPALSVSESKVVQRWTKGIEWAHWCPFGATLTAYRDMKRHPGVVARLAAAHGAAEAAAARGFLDAPGWCAAEYDPELTSMCSTKGLVPPAHLVEDPAKATSNDLDLGLPDRNTTLHLLTSPNAGGKSTLLKTIGTAVVTSRALGAAPGERFVWRKSVDHLDTLLQLRDEGGKASLYQAELQRVASVVRKLQEKDEDRTTLVLIDEMFNTTNAREGEAAAAGVLRWALQDRDRPNCCLVVSTHLHGLSCLADVRGCCPWRMSPEKRYVVQPGFTKECVGLDLLRKCMPKGVVARAEEHVSRVSAAESPPDPNSK